MKSSDQVGITFVNAVTGSGILNNVVNLQLGSLNFDATEDGKVSNDLSVACRLRMDRSCAQQIHDALGGLLVLFEKAESEAAVGIAANGDARQPEGKPN